MKTKPNNNTKPQAGTNILLATVAAWMKLLKKPKSTETDASSELNEAWDALALAAGWSTVSGLSNMRNVKGDKILFQVTNSGDGVSETFDCDKKTHIESRYGRQSDYHVPVEAVENAKEFLWNIIRPENRDLLLELSDYFKKPEGKIITHVNLEIKLRDLRNYTQKNN
jgi:hypothetical protein